MPRKQYAAIISGRTNTITPAKYGKFMAVMPAIMHSTSSGKKGRICIIRKIPLLRLPM